MQTVMSDRVIAASDQFSISLDSILAYVGNNFNGYAKNKNLIPISFYFTLQS